MKQLVRVVLVWMILILPAHANGESAIYIENEVVTISPELVHVEYDFKNNTHAALTKLLEINLPSYSYDPTSRCPDVARRTSHFNLVAKGKVVNPIVSFKARLPLTDGSFKDVTPELRSMGFTDDEISNYRNYDVACENDVPMPQGKYEANLKRLIKDGLAQEEDFHPTWQVSEVHSLKQDFGPDETVHVVYEYNPTVGDENNNMGPGPVILKGNSISLGFRDLDKDDARCVILGAPIDTKKASQVQSQFTFRSILHNVTADAALYGVVKDFTLKVKKVIQRNNMSICFDNKISSDDEITLSSHIKNYLPSKDIIVDYLYQSN